MIVTALHFRLCSEPHLSSLINHMLSIMTHIINEETSLPLLEVVLWNLVKQEKVRVWWKLFPWLYFYAVKYNDQNFQKSNDVLHYSARENELSFDPFFFSCCTLVWDFFYFELSSMVISLLLSVFNSWLSRKNAFVFLLVWQYDFLALSSITGFTICCFSACCFCHP